MALPAELPAAAEIASPRGGIGAGSGANASLAAGPSLTQGVSNWTAQAIHVALIVGGQTRHSLRCDGGQECPVSPVNPIHLHLVTAGRAERVLKTLFSNLENSSPQSVYGLLKLTLALRAARSLERVIVLDTDVAVTADPSSCGSCSASWPSGPASLSLADNLSDWYLSGKAGVWPALGRGFNTGVMLMHARQAAGLGLGQALACRGQGDVINALVRRHPGLLYRIPCYWNVQLGDHTQPELVRILHWNSPLKVWGARRHRFAQHFHTLYMTYLDYDGGLLRRRLFACPDDGAEDDQDQLLAEDASGANSLAGPAAAGVSAGDECYEMRAEQRLVRRTHLYYLEYNYTAQGPHDVTLVSQLSLDRVQLLESLSRHWAGPISLCIYVTDAEAHQLATFVESSQVLRHRRNIAYHLLMKEGQFYPVNRLRNVAMENAVTTLCSCWTSTSCPVWALRASQVRDCQILRPATAAEGGPALCRIRDIPVQAAIPRQQGRVAEPPQPGEIVPFRQEVFREGAPGPRTSPVEVGHPVVPGDLARLTSSPTWSSAGTPPAGHSGIRFPSAAQCFIVHLLPHAPSLDVARFRFIPEYRHCINTLKVEYIKYWLRGMESARSSILSIS
uniref:Uncharacterized protein n=1 Tax=Macrostomum lignano TaxID=282301 RepID=A0A1I8FA84_9PLAT